MRKPHGDTHTRVSTNRSAIKMMSVVGKHITGIVVRLNESIHDGIEGELRMAMISKDGFCQIATDFLK